VISAGELQEARTRSDRVLHRIEGQVDQYRDELELIQIRLRRQQAELERFKGQREMAAAVNGLNTRLNSRQKGLVSNDELAKGDAALVVANADVKTAELDCTLLEAQLRQLERRLAPLVEFLKTQDPKRADPSSTPSR
jgi:hypothetical protein